MIEGVAHIGIAVRSIEESRGFYEAMGLEIERIEEVPQEQVRVAFIHCGECELELLEATSPDSPIATFIAKRGPGVHHVCLKSNDVTEDDSRLRRAGIHLLREEPTTGAGGTRVQFVHPRSTGGVLVELAQDPESP